MRKQKYLLKIFLLFLGFRILVFENEGKKGIVSENRCWWLCLEIKEEMQEDG